jgi:hypothetical protein
MQDPTDNLSPTGRKVLTLNSDAYRRLVVTGGGSPETKDILESIQPDELVVGGARRVDEARAMLAGLWLWHDWLDESHTISQGITSPTGSYWHAIMHRREGDFSNGKYWYARCATHPVLTSLAVQAASFLNPLPADKSLLKLTLNNAWHPSAFVDLVEAVHDRPDDPRHRIAVSLQQLEWRVLFDYCTRVAAGGAG